MTFAVITDSTADLAPEVAAAHNIDVIPLVVTIGEDTFTDGALPQAEFFARMAAAPELPMTSQPPIGVFINAYERALSTADEVLSVHIAAKLSGTVEAARQAAQQFAGRVHVFDSYNLSAGLGIQVLEAAASAASGLSLSATIERLEGIRNRMRLIIGLDSLANLSKGGRIGKVSAFLGSMLDLKVTMFVDTDLKGSFAPVARSRGEKAALRHTIDWVAEQATGAVKGKFAVGYATKRERAEWLADQLRERFEAVEMYIYEAGSVICTHTGTGWGVAFLPEE
ncbi:MAG: DegV family protein [Coriobacteriia bacterium]|nr:DegV family protein [Coriobacteriia bacterium]